MRAKMDRFAAENGNKRAVEKFSRELKRPLSQNTVRGFKKAYYSELKKVKDPDMISELMHGARGRPVKLGDLDQKLQVYISKLRPAGTPVNCSIVTAAARGMVVYHNPSLLPERGRKLELGRKWAESLMSRMGLVHRKAKKAARKIPQDFDNLKAPFLGCIKSDYSVPSALILNLDQTATKLVPIVSGQWQFRVLNKWMWWDWRTNVNYCGFVLYPIR